MTATNKKFYVTTPIYYANWLPHIGTAYTTLIADLLARTKRMVGYDVKFATWMDENGQKMTRTATEAGKGVMEFLDEIAGSFRSTWDAMDISYTDFIRTTEERHKEFVQLMLQKTHDAWDLYQWSYEWLYCVGCEAFKKEGDLVEHNGEMVCELHLKKPDGIKEKNWFFKLSAYEEKLKELYAQYPWFCVPEHRFNEIKSFVDQWLEDFSASRQGSDFGIPLPFDDESVTYIWFDALYNYLTVCQWGDEAYRNEWEVVHTLGKDIGRFHAIYWPAMLMSLWQQLPNKLIINWFFTVDGQKISKSLGNAIDPLELIEKHWRDALVYYLFSDIKIGNDGDFSWDRFETTKDAVLMKGRWNLVSRVVTLCKKNEVHNIEISDEQVQVFHARAIQEGAPEDLLCMITWWFDCGILNKYIDWDNITGLMRDWYQLVQLGNKYVNDKEPWVVAKTDPESARVILSLLLWYIKWVALISAPFLTESFEKFKDIVQVDHAQRKVLKTDTTVDWWSEIWSLQKFYTKFWESKYLY